MSSASVSSICFLLLSNNYYLSIAYLSFVELNASSQKASTFLGIELHLGDAVLE